MGEEVTTVRIMEPRISLITLGVTDLPRAIHFYRNGLGFPTTAKDDEPVAFFVSAALACPC